MTEPTRLTKAELVAELARLEAEEAEEAATARRLRWANLLANKAALLAVFPEHDRTSCSDDNVANGFYSRSDNGPRCTRCALLEAEEWNGEDFEFSLELSFNYVSRG